MYICLCNGVTERDIRQAAKAGCRNVAELTMRTGCGATCGSCIPMAAELLEEERACTLAAISEDALEMYAQRLPSAA